MITSVTAIRDFWRDRLFFCPARSGRGSRCRVSLQFGVSDQGFRAVHGNIHKITSYFIHLDLCRGSWYRKKRMTLLQTSLLLNQEFMRRCSYNHALVHTVIPLLHSSSRHARVALLLLKQRHKCSPRSIVTMALQQVLEHLARGVGRKGDSRISQS